MAIQIPVYASGSYADVRQWPTESSNRWVARVVDVVGQHRRAWTTFLHKRAVQSPFPGPEHTSSYRMLL